MADEQQKPKKQRAKLLKGFQVACSHPQCGPIGFRKKRDDAEAMMDEHNAMHDTYEQQRAEKLKQYGIPEVTVPIEGEPDVKLNCPRCGVEIGSPHTMLCDAAQCLQNGGQRRLEAHRSKLELKHNCGHDVWTGYFPGEKEAFDYGVPLRVLKEVGFWDTTTKLWKMPDDYQQRIAEAGLGPAIAADSFQS